MVPGRQGDEQSFIHVQGDTGMTPLYRTLGIGMGITALTLAPFVNPLWAQYVVETAAPTQETTEKVSTPANEVEHVKRAAVADAEEKAPVVNMDDKEPAATEKTTKTDAAKSDDSKKDDPTATLAAESKMLSAEADLRAKKLAAELADLKEEGERLKAQAEIAKQRQANALLQMELEKQKLSTEAALAKAKQDQAQSDMKAELDELSTNMQLRDARHKRELAEMKAQIERISTERQLDKARTSQGLASLEDQRDKLMLEMAVKQAQFQKQTLENNLKTNDMQTQLQIAQGELSLKSVDEQQKMQLNGELTYRKNPFDKETGTLYISDRRIKLDGPIITGTADYICERIHFFNNESLDKPIFIVIDNCPGGSVMQGYRIVKAIESSTAPVHVVVKSFAASMAAIITTLAPHSYAYPDAIILHHQMSAGAYGNMTDLQQQLDTMKQWERRLAEPVSVKMGISVADFKQKMYDHRKTGDWDEFADNAVKLKWVDHIVNEIREEGTRKRPQGDPPQPWWYRFFFQDEKGHTYCKLPPLEPMDAYMMYNPGNFYRMD
jgi:ATP-dependent Clp protease protease subunit